MGIELGDPKLKKKSSMVKYVWIGLVVLGYFSAEMVFKTFMIAALLVTQSIGMKRPSLVKKEPGLSYCLTFPEHKFKKLERGSDKFFFVIQKAAGSSITFKDEKKSYTTISYNTGGYLPRIESDVLGRNWDLYNTSRVYISTNNGPQALQGNPSFESMCNENKDAQGIVYLWFALENERGHSEKEFHKPGKLSVYQEGNNTWNC